MRVLLVEDDMRTASFIMKGFKQAGFVVDHASNGEHALYRAINESFDVMIVDIMLPELDGLALIEKLRKKKVLTPVIILSAKSSLDDRVRGLETGSDDYMIKPFAFSGLEFSLRHGRIILRRLWDLTGYRHLPLLLQ